MHSILLWPLGGFAFVGHSSTPAKDMFVAAAGPLTHIPMFLIWLGALAIAASVVYHRHWDFSLAVPAPRNHFFLALCASAAQASPDILKLPYQTSVLHCRFYTCLRARGRRSRVFACIVVKC